MSSDKDRARQAKELYELKQKAMAYYEENGVSKKMEDILNNMFYDNPDDVYGHLANYFEKYANIPTISKLKGRLVYDSKAQPTLQTEVYCTVKNFEKLIETVTSSNESYPPESARPEDQEQSVIDRLKAVQAAVAFTTQHMEPVIKQQDPTKQQELDAILLNTLEKLQVEEEERLAKEKEEKGDEETQSQVSAPAATANSPTKRKSAKDDGSVLGSKGKAAKGPAVVVVPDEPREALLSGCGVVAALSQALCQTGSTIANVPLYQHIATSSSGQVPSNYRLPLPMVTILSSGRVWPGKQNCVKEFMIVPRPTMSMTECIKHVTEIYNFCAKSLSAKTGVISKNVNDVGALCPTYDRPEQGLDLLQEAITQQGLNPGEDFHIALNLQGHEIFDYEKGKYEVTAGAQKTPEDLPDFYGDLLTRYPAIIAIIDPCRKQEKESWMRLCERVTEKCYVAGDSVYHRPGLLKDEEIPEDFKTSAVVLRLENVNTVTDIAAAVKKMKDCDNEVILSCQTAAESMDTFLVDMAVGLNVKFLKVGAPCRGERIVKLNRLLQLEAQLEEASQLAQWPGEHQFTIVKPPTPPPEETGDRATPASAKSERK